MIKNIVLLGNLIGFIALLFVNLIDIERHWIFIFEAVKHLVSFLGGS